MEQRIDNLCELNDSLFSEDAVNLLVIRKINRHNIKCSEFLSANNIIFETQSVPEWIEKLNTKYKGFDNHNILELYRYTGAIESDSP